MSPDHYGIDSILTIPSCRRRMRRQQQCPERCAILTIALALMPRAQVPSSGRLAYVKLRNVHAMEKAGSTELERLGRCNRCQ